MKKRNSIPIVMLCIIFLLCGCTVAQVDDVKNVDALKHPEPEMIKISIKEEEIPVSTPNLITIHQEEILQDRYATITSFGDTLCHESVFKDAYDADAGEYDFSPIFKNVEKYFKEENLNIGNAESPMAGADRGYSGYPCFNAPEHLAIDLSQLNVDIMTTANNHCLDKGYSGLEETLNNFDEAKISHVGTSRSKEEQDTILFKDLNGIKTAFLSFTYGTNGIAIPDGKEYSVNLINEDLILEQINRAKEEGADLIISSMHWGVEYQTTENSEQDRLAEFLVKNDVKIILGCHPHVLQPMRMLTLQNDDGEEKEGLVIFSQGNFFSAQTKVNTRNTAIFNIRVKKDAITDKITIDEATYIPLYLYDNGNTSKDRYELLDLNEIIRSYDAGEGIWSENLYKLALTEQQRCIDTIGPFIQNDTSSEDSFN